MELKLKDHYPKTGQPTMCISCTKERVLHWSGPYTQFFCAECIKALPVKGKRFKRLKVKLMNRKYSLRDTEKWLKKQNINSVKPIG